MWVYTDYGERFSREYGISRKAGAPAEFAGELLTEHDQIALAWRGHGFIEWKEEAKHG